MKDTPVFDLLPTALTVSTAQESARMSKLDTLPVLTSFMALALGRAVLHLADGSSLTVDAPRDGVTMLNEAPCDLALGRAAAAPICHVPAHLHPSVCAALHLGTPNTPPQLTLTGIERPEDEGTVKLHALDGEGRDVALTMPRPLHTRLGFPVPRHGGMPVQVSISPKPLETLEGAQQAFRFSVYPETSEGRAVLEVLGYAVQLDDDGKGVTKTHTPGS